MSKKNMAEENDIEIKTAETEQAVDDVDSEEQNDSADEVVSDDGSKEKAQKKQLIWEIVSCVIAVAAIIVAMILVIKSKEKEVQITHLYERAATIYDPGNIDCWYNVTTGRYYSDKKCKEEISEDEALTYFFDRKLSGVVQSGVKHYYVTGGTADRSFNGFAKDENDDWYYFENGISYENADDVVKGTVDGEDGWWCIRGGKVAFVDTVAENVNGMWYIKNGKVLFEDAIAESETGSWYCKGGKVDYDYNGKYEYNGKTYKIENGKVVKVY